MVGWFKYVFRPTRCIICTDRIKPNEKTGKVKYRYIEDGESKVSTGIICKSCLDVMEQNTPETDIVGGCDDEAI